MREHKFFRFGYNEHSEVYEIESREFPKVKQQLLNSLTNRGQPIISVVDGNHKNRGELYTLSTYVTPASSFRSTTRATRSRTSIGCGTAQYTSQTILEDSEGGPLVRRIRSRS